VFSPKLDYSCFERAVNCYNFLTLWFQLPDPDYQLDDHRPKHDSGHRPKNNNELTQRRLWHGSISQHSQIRTARSKILVRLPQFDHFWRFSNNFRPKNRSFQNGLAGSPFVLVLLGNFDFLAENYSENLQK